MNSNHEITTQIQKRKNFLPHRDLKRGPLELEANELPMGYADPYYTLVYYCYCQSQKMFRILFDLPRSSNCNKDLLLQINPL